MSIMDILGNVTIILGALIFATAALGVLRFPCAYSRISAVGTAGGLGIVLVVTGALLLQPTWLNLVKAIFIIVLQLVTSTIGTVAIARSAALVGTPMGDLRFDELGDVTVPEEDRDLEETIAA